MRLRHIRHRVGTATQRRHPSPQRQQRRQGSSSHGPPDVPLRQLAPEKMYKAGDLISIGSWSSLTKKFTAEHVREFSALSEDRNPIHLDDAYAAQTQFGRKIVHGFLSASLISAIAGTALPGPGTIYLNQTLQFRKPVFVDDTVTAAVKVLSIRHTKRLVTFETTCYNQNDDVVISGQALVLVPADRLPPSPPADSDTS